MSRKRRSAAAKQRRSPRPQAKTPWWKRPPVIWTGGVVSALILGAAGAFGSGLGQSLFSGAAGQLESSSSVTASPTAESSLTSTSALGLDVQSSLFWLPGVDTFFITKNVFQPSGQVAATLVNQSGTAYLSIFRSIGAVNQAQTVLRLIFTGESSQGIRILNITPVITKRAAPWRGDLFEFPIQGVAPTIKTSLDLDSDLPVVEDGTGRPYFEDNTITLQEGEQEVFFVQVTASRGFVAYELRVDYLIGSQERDITVTDHGQPFELSAVNCVRKDIESYGLVFVGTSASVNAARQPSQIKSDCLPN